MSIGLTFVDYRVDMMSSNLNSPDTGSIQPAGFISGAAQPLVPIALAPIITGIIGCCPVYTFLGVCPNEQYNSGSDSWSERGT